MEQKFEIVGQRSYDEDEIDLYEVIEILVRNKMIIIITTIVFTILSFGAALYVRTQKDNYLMKNIIISQDLNVGGLLKGLNVIQPESIILRNDNVKELLGIEGVKEKYLEITSKELQNINSERKFLKEIISIEIDSKKPENVILKAKIVANEKATEELIKKYVEMISAESNLKDLVAEEVSIKKAELNKIAEEIEKMEAELTNIFKNDMDLRDLKTEDKINYLNLKYPTLILKKSELEKYYTTYSDDLIKLNNMNLRGGVVKEASDIYLEEGKSKAKLILGIGVVFGIFLGIMFAFLKEFIDGYKKRYL